MLGAVWITRPEYEHEELLASLEDRQHRFRRDIPKNFCCSTLAINVPGTVLPPALALAPRVGACAGSSAALSCCLSSSDSGMPPARPVMSSTTKVF